MSCGEIINRIETTNKIFEGIELRSVWDSEKEDYYFSVIDVIGALTNGYTKILKKEKF